MPEENKSRDSMIIEVESVVADRVREWHNQEKEAHECEVGEISNEREDVIE